MYWSLNQWSRSLTRVMLACMTVLLCIGTAMSQAQSNAADLQGTIRDPNGAAIVNANVMARNLGTNLTREATTNEDGFYKILNLPPGNYEVTVKAPNYKTGVIHLVTLTVGQTATQDIGLEVGDVTATVTVSSTSANVVDASTSAVS